MKDFMVIKATKQAVILPWYMRYSRILRDMLILSCGAFWLIVFAVIVGLR